MNPPGPITHDGAAADARRELSKAGYQRDRPSLIQRLVTAILDHVQHALDKAADTVPGGYLGLLIIVVLVVVAVVAIVVRLNPSRVRDILGDRAPAGERREKAADFRAEADVLTAAGDLSGAIRATTRAMVRELEDRGVLEPRPGSTTAVLAQQAAAAVPAVGPDAGLVTSAFDSVWYAGHPATPELAATARAAELRVKSQRLRVMADIGPTPDPTGPAGPAEPEPAAAGRR